MAAELRIGVMGLVRAGSGMLSGGRILTYLQTLLEKIRKDDSGKPWRLSALPQDCPPAFQAWLREMALGAEENEPGHWFKVGEDCLKKLEGRKLHNRLILLNKDIKAAEGSGNEKQLLELLSEKKRAMEALK